MPRSAIELLCSLFQYVPAVSCTPQIGAGERRAIERQIAKHRGLTHKIARMAERVGFEPTVRFPAHTLSKRAP